MSLVSHSRRECTNPKREESLDHERPLPTGTLVLRLAGVKSLPGGNGVFHLDLKILFEFSDDPLKEEEEEEESQGQVQRRENSLDNHRSDSHTQ